MNDMLIILLLIRGYPKTMKSMLTHEGSPGGKMGFGIGSRHI